MRDRSRPEHGTDHGCGVCATFRVRGELVESRTDQTPDVGRDRQLVEALAAPSLGINQTTVAKHADGLFEKQRISAGVSYQRCRDGRFRECGVAKQLFEKCDARLLSQDVQGNRGSPSGCSQRRTRQLGELRSSGAEEHEGHVAVVRCHECDQLQKGRFRPVKVFEDDERRTLPRKQLECAPDSPVQLRLVDLRRGVCAARRGRATKDVRECGCDRA